MRNIKILLAAVLTIIIGITYAQPLGTYWEDQFDDIGTSGRSANSENSYIITNKGVIRVFLVFAETLNDPSDNLPPNSNWSTGSMPINASSYFDANYTNPASIAGYLTKYFYQASFGQYIVLGDYYPNIVQVDYNQMVLSGTDGFPEVVNYLQSLPGNDIVTANNKHINNVDFDKWTLPVNYVCGEPKVNSPDDYIDFIIVLWRVNNRVGTCDGSGSTGNNYITSFKNKDGFMAYCNFKSSNSSAYTGLRHEFSHQILGGNNMHTGGAGASPRTFMPSASGYSMLGSWDCSSITWNAWDRHRMGWKYAGNTNLISAHCASDYSVQNTDLTYGQTLPCSSNEFILRDFVTYGDAIRIKLPYLQSENASTLNQYIWLENHQIINGNIDHSSNTTKGIYSYIQVGKDDKTSFGGLGNYTYPLCAYGNYDFGFDITWDKLIVNTANANPLSGNHFLMRQAMDVVTSPPDKIYFNEILRPNAVEENGTLIPTNSFNYGTYPVFGTIWDAFTVGKKISISTNPASTPKLTYKTKDDGTAPIPPIATDNRKIFLNGLSIEVIEQYANGDIRVKIRYNDFDINNDVRWCGDIILKEQLHIQNNKIVTLDQGLTPQKPINPIIYNGNKVYADPTILTCKSGSVLEVHPGAKLIVKNGSKLVIETGSTLLVDDGGQIIIEANGTIEYNGGTINLNGNNALLEIQGNLNIASNANFTFTGAGYVKFSSTANPSNNITAGTNSKITLIGTNYLDKVLEVTQETLNLTALSEVTATYCGFSLAKNTRITVNNKITLNFMRITAITPNITNLHKGLYLYGQSNVSIQNSIFEWGINGINANLTTGNTKLTLTNCDINHCTTGLYTYAKDVDLIDCDFTYNTSNGWQAAAMDRPCTATTSTFLNNGTGIYFAGTASSPLKLSSCIANSNTSYGVRVAGASTLTVQCTNINTNGNHGLYMQAGASLNMSPALAPFGGNNSVTGNSGLANIYMLSCNQLNLTGGLNNLEYASGKYSVKAYLTGYGCGANTHLSALNNHWNVANSSPVSGTDYVVSTISCTPNQTIFLDDAAPSFSGCGGGGGAPQFAGSMLSTSTTATPLDNVSSVRNINTQSFGTIKLSKAVKQMETDMQGRLSNSQLITVISKLNEILMCTMQNTNADEEWLINTAYSLMNYAVGIAYQQQAISNQGNRVNNSVQKLLNVQDKLLSNYTSNYEMKLMLSLDKALTYRLSDRRDLAMSDINGILSWVNTSDNEYISNWKCMIQVEQDVLCGVISKYETEEAYALCNSSSSASRLTHATGNDELLKTEAAAKVTAISSVNDLALQNENNLLVSPNPVTGNSTIVVSVAKTAQKAELVITTLMGIKVNTLKLACGANLKQISSNQLDAGTYNLVLYIDGIAVTQKQMVIVK